MTNIMDKYSYLIRKPCVIPDAHSISPAGSVQRQQIERMIERAGGIVVDSHTNILYSGVDSYTSMMLFSEAYHKGWVRKI